GATVHVSMVGFDKGDEHERVLNGQVVAQINADLTASTTDLTGAVRLAENGGLAFMGTTKGGVFDINEVTALGFLREPNSHGLPNSDVVVPWVNGRDIAGRPRGMWIIDYGVNLSEEEAANYEAPFEYLRAQVKPEREKNARESYRRLWWRHVEARPALR